MTHPNWPAFCRVGYREMIVQTVRCLLHSSQNRFISIDSVFISGQIWPPECWRKIIIIFLISADGFFNLLCRKATYKFVFFWRNDSLISHMRLTGELTMKLFLIGADDIKNCDCHGRFFFTQLLSFSLIIWKRQFFDKSSWDFVLSHF